MTVPDQLLVASCHDLDGLDAGAVASDRSVILPIGPNQVSQHLGVPRIGLGARHRVPISIAAHREGIDGEDRVAGGHQVMYEKAAVGLEADDEFNWRAPELRGKLVEPCDSDDALGDAESRPLSPQLIQNTDVVVLFGPVDTHEEHGSSSNPE